MNCPLCKTEMVLTRATDFGDEYYYCRPCKRELSEMTPKLEAAPKSSKCTTHVFEPNSTYCRNCGKTPWAIGVDESQAKCNHIWDSSALCVLCGKSYSAVGPQDSFGATVPSYVPINWYVPPTKKTP